MEWNAVFPADSSNFGDRVYRADLVVSIDQRYHRDICPKPFCYLIRVDQSELIHGQVFQIKAVKACQIFSRPGDSMVFNWADQNAISLALLAGGKRGASQGKIVAL